MLARLIDGSDGVCLCVSGRGLDLLTVPCTVFVLLGGGDGRCCCLPSHPPQEYDIHTLLDGMTLCATGWVIFSLRGPLRHLDPIVYEPGTLQITVVAP